MDWHHFFCLRFFIFILTEVIQSNGPQHSQIQTQNLSSVAGIVHGFFVGPMLTFPDDYFGIYEWWMATGLKWGFYLCPTSGHSHVGHHFSAIYVTYIYGMGEQWIWSKNVSRKEKFFMREGHFKWDREKKIFLVKASEFSFLFDKNRTQRTNLILNLQHQSGN